MASATPTATILVVRPPATRKLAATPLQKIEDCTVVDLWQNSYSAWVNHVWPKLYMGLHEGLDAQATAKRDKCIGSIGHALARSPNNTCALLDFSIRRGHDVSCRDLRKQTVLYLALWSPSCRHQDALTTLHFFQVFADASKNNVVEQVHQYIRKTEKHLDQNQVDFLNKIVELFDRQAEM
jgi:hypothetical protein